MSKKDEADKKDGNEEKSSLNSAVTTDMENTAAEEEAQAKAVAKAEEAPKGPEERANDAGIGLVKVDGNDFRYVGVAPARDKESETPDGFPITPMNSTFTPLGNISFDRSIRVKDPKSGEFYFPADGISSWDACELNGSYLIPRAEKSAKK